MKGQRSTHPNNGVNKRFKAYAEITVPQCTLLDHINGTCPYSTKDQFIIPDIDPYAGLPNPEDLINGSK